MDRGCATRIDFFAGGRDGPIVVFIHGGYWQALDGSFFSHLAAGLNAHGISVAIPSYDLCPAVTVDQIIEQMRMAARELARLQRPLVVSGHSAGGHLAACLIATDWTGVRSGVAGRPRRCGLRHFRPVRTRTAGRNLHQHRAASRPRRRQRREPAVLERRHRAAALMRWSARAKARNISGKAAPWSSAGARPASRPGSASIPDANHFTAIAPLADPISPMVSPLAGTGGALGLTRKRRIARIWAIAPNYFKYKMFATAPPDGGVEPLSNEDDGNVGCSSQPWPIGSRR